MRKVKKKFFFSVNDEEIYKVNIRVIFRLRDNQ